MLDTLSRFISDLAGGQRTADSFEHTDQRLAAAALLVHASAVDGRHDAAEDEALSRILSRRFDLDASETRALLARARQRDQESVDLYGFTSVLNRSLDEAGKIRMIEMLWEIVYADGEVDEFEDNLIWRVAELLGVHTRERVRMRQRVEAKRQD